MEAIRHEVERTRRPRIVPQVPSEDIGAALSFPERAFGFREIRSSRMEGAAGVIHHASVECGGSVIGIGTQGARGAVSPKRAGSASQYTSVYVEDIDAHDERAPAPA
jgi:uncharacterized glyoxalase superfamily protein PhnB